MTKQYDTIIWGPSLEGIKKAIELKNEGQQVLLCGKFGFPGGKASESLASLFPLDYFNDNGILAHLLEEVKLLRFGVLFQNAQWVLLHPEAVKRICWQMINDHNIEILFHVIPLEIKKEEKTYIDLFGREGKLTITTDTLLDLSDDKYLNNLTGEPKSRDMVINSFFNDPLPADFPGFQIIRRFETPIGQYISLSVKNVASGEIEQTFNRELDRLSKESWKKHQARILMVPVYPEVK